jgi:hypothetical protein
LPVERPQAVVLPDEQMALGQRSLWLTVEQWPQAEPQPLVWQQQLIRRLARE